MALIKCPECARDVSDQASSCPHCGYPMQRTNGATPASAGGSELDALVRRALIEQGKVAAIKLYRERKPGSGLAAAKEYVERIETTVPPGVKADSKRAGCLGVFIVVVSGAVLFCALWIWK